MAPSQEQHMAPSQEQHMAPSQEQNPNHMMADNPGPAKELGPNPDQTGQTLVVKQEQDNIITGAMVDKKTSQCNGR
jgi:hypothetical protein